MLTKKFKLRLINDLNFAALYIHYFGFESHSNLNFLLENVPLHCSMYYVDALLENAQTPRVMQIKVKNKSIFFRS